MTIANWGNYPRVARHTVVQPRWRSENPFNANQTLLPHGNGRSYGDSALNTEGAVIHTRYLDNFISFDAGTGRLCCESGVLLATILALCVPKGWMLPVLPGTQYVTVGGAIANDVHGKNHYVVGSFGCHVTALELLRSDGQRIRCALDNNDALFKATIGGLGLTGLIVWAEIQLKPIISPFVQVKTTPFQGMPELLQLAKEASTSAEYLVAWLDCQSRQKNRLRGLLMTANSVLCALPISRRLVKQVPACFPSFVLNSWSISAVNRLHYYLGSRRADQTCYYEPYFFPLDNWLNWNRLYGRQGFLQYQLVVPFGAESILEVILSTISNSEIRPFLSVLKLFGHTPAPGIMSFATPGVTLALDFPNRKPVFSLLQALDELVMAVGGRVYIAKDARMSAKAFQQYYPQYDNFLQWLDPGTSSDFWRRVIHEGV